MEIAPEKLPDSRKPQHRAAVTNGRDVLPGVDGRSLVARRYFDIQSAICAEQAGAMTETRLQLVRRFAAAACLAEQLEAKLANGEQINIGEHALLCSTMVRVAQRIGLKSIPRDVTGLGELLRRDFERQLQGQHPDAPAAA